MDTSPSVKIILFCLLLTSFLKSVWTLCAFIQEMNSWRINPSFHRWEFVTSIASSFLDKIQLLSSRGHSKSTSVGKGRIWFIKWLTKSDISWRGCNRKSDITHSIFFYAQFSSFSVFPSVILDGVVIVLL